MKLSDENERNRIQHNLVAVPTFKARTKRVIAMDILMNAPYLGQGVLFDVRVKHLGAGVYEVSRQAGERGDDG